MGKICGMDVSYAQGSINWEQVKASKKIEFAILRAGYGRETSQVDTQFERNYAACKRLGIPVGVYWYSYATTAAEAEQEAKVCLQTIRGKQFEYPVAFDIEEARSLPQADALCTAFCNALEKQGYYAEFIRLSRLWKITLVQQLRAAMTFFSRTLACNRLLTLEHMGCGSIAGRDAFREFPVMWIWIMPTKIIQP